MAKPFAISFYRRKSWKQCRRSFIAHRMTIDGGQCQRCDSQGYIVDHVIELTEGNIEDSSIALNHENLQYLCFRCHDNKRYKENRYIRDDLMFTDDGDVVERI